jgi:hypothetical protein
MSVSVVFALVAYSLILAGSLIFAQRASTWRIRLLAYTVGLLSICQGAISLGKHNVGITADIAAIAQVLEIFVTALCLVVLQLMTVENSDSKKTGARVAAPAESLKINNAATSPHGPIAASDRRRTVDRRKEPRLPGGCPVMVTVLGSHTPLTVLGNVQDMSGRGLGLKLDSPIECGTPVKVEGHDILMLGEVCRCQPAQGHYSLGLRISQWLSSPSELESLTGMRRPRRPAFVEKNDPRPRIADLTHSDELAQVK